MDKDKREALEQFLDGRNGLVPPNATIQRIDELTWNGREYFHIHFITQSNERYECLVSMTCVPFHERSFLNPHEDDCHDYNARFKDVVTNLFHESYVDVSEHEYENIYVHYIVSTPLSNVYRVMWYPIHGDFPVYSSQHPSKN